MRDGPSIVKLSGYVFLVMSLVGAVSAPAVYVPWSLWGFAEIEALLTY